MWTCGAGSGFCLTWLLELVGNDASHEVWMRAVECGHQLVQLFLVVENEQSERVRRTHATLAVQVRAIHSYSEQVSQ